MKVSLFKKKVVRNLRLILLILLLGSFVGEVKAINSEGNLGIIYEEVKKMSDYLGLSDFEEYNIVYIKGEKERKDTEVMIKGLFQTLLLGTKSQRTSRIVRLDKNLIWNNIFPEKGTYSELTFNQLYDNVKEAEEKIEEKEEKTEKDLKVSLQKVRIYQSGKKKKINNFPCEEFILEVIKICDEPENKQRVIRHIISKIWKTKENEILRQIREFDEQFFKKLGEAPMEIINNWLISAFFSGFQREMTSKIEEEIVQNISQIEGYYPILSTMVIKMGTTTLTSKIDIKFSKKEGFKIIKREKEQIEFIEVVKMDREVKNFQIVPLEDEIFEIDSLLKFREKEEAEKPKEEGN